MIETGGLVGEGGREGQLLWKGVASYGVLRVKGVLMGGSASYRQGWGSWRSDGGGLCRP